METQSYFLDSPNDRWGSHGDLVAYQRVLPMNFLYITGNKRLILPSWQDLTILVL